MPNCVFDIQAATTKNGGVFVHRRRTTTVYSAAHFLVDFACAYLVYGAVNGLRTLSEALFWYNFCAFALQMPLGVFADRYGNGRVFSAAGCILVALSAFFGSAPLLLCLLSGVGNALFHIGGGFDILSLSGNRARLLGMFVSPGALGLFAGALLSGYAPLRTGIIAVLALASAMILILCPRIQPDRSEEKTVSARSAKYLFSVLLFFAVALRSYGGFLFSFPWKSGAWSWVFILCVVLGKSVGGFLHDRFGGLVTSIVSLAGAAVLFLLSGHPLAGCAAVLLFNMTMPLTLRAAADILSPMRGFAFGLLTFALFIGFIPVWMRLPFGGGKVAYTGLCLLTMALLAPVFVKKSDGGTVV